MLWCVRIRAHQKIEGTSSDGPGRLQEEETPAPTTEIRGRAGPGASETSDVPNGATRDDGREHLREEGPVGLEEIAVIVSVKARQAIN